MKSLVKISLVIASISLSTISALANTTDVKTLINRLALVEMEVEEGVEDVIFSLEEQVRYTHLQIVSLSPDSLEEDEAPVNDVEFSNSEAVEYQNNCFTLELENLNPVTQEEEEAVDDIDFVEAEKKKL